ncbi:MAG: cysteine desulfurase [Treponema sp.]|jgi:cysteine desulfurase|nr:cysteine desulfurase [Treponema sp.]
MIRRYFDWAATAIPGPPPREGSAFPYYGNPSSPHAEGREARKALEEARSRCAAVLGVRREELVFTSGGTESNALVLFSLLCRPRAGGNGGAAELLYSAVEHPSIRENSAVLERLGVACAKIAVGREGGVSRAALEKALAKNPRAKMAALMAVNNETGAVNALRDLSAAAKRGSERLHIHCDLVQAAGKIPVDIGGWGIDSASISAHKIGGPRGAGLLWLKKPLPVLIRGGGQEGRIRPGTENTAGALELARRLEERAAPESLDLSYREASARMAALLARLRRIPRFVPVPESRADEDPRFSPWILQAAFSGIPGEVMVRALDERGFAVSTGSACSSADKKRPVLDAMGVDPATAFSGIRISQGWSTGMDDIEALAETVEELCEKL